MATMVIVQRLACSGAFVQRTRWRLRYWLGGSEFVGGHVYSGAL